MNVQTVIVAGLIFVWGATPVLTQEAALLTKLPKNATSPVIGLKNGGIGPTGKELNLGGWLVLNGALFPNADYPALAQLLKENYAQQGLVSNDPDFTQLPREPYEAKPNGEIVRGFAICPLPALCGDPGTLMPFDLDSSL
jgi:hypothetical protein